MKLSKYYARKFWFLIITAIETAEARGSEGNSGEFHNPKEAAKLEKEYENIINKLRYEFLAHTGWLPEKKIKNDLETWSLTQP
jgi:hypothetical protein